MIRVFLWSLLFFHSLFGAVLLNENLYERENRVDLMLSFDSPFQGSIKKSTDEQGDILIYLDGVEVDKPFFQTLQNSFVDSVSVMKSNRSQALVKIVPNHSRLGLQASKTVDGFGLRLRIYPLAAASKNSQEAASAASTVKSKVNTTSAPSESMPLNRLDDSDILPQWRYWAVMGLLLAALLILWWIKKRGTRPGGWLMPGGKSSLGPDIPAEAIIRYQKPLDPHNRVVLLEYGNKQYLMVIGNSNLLLDTFTEGRIEEEEDFTRMFEANRRELDHFLKENHPDAYEAFKANASKEPLE